MNSFIPGELIIEEGYIELNKGKTITKVMVANTSDRPIQVGSHFHFYESNGALIFDREITIGHRLDIPAGTAIRFEPGDEREVNLIPFGGKRRVFGFNGKVNSSLD